MNNLQTHQLASNLRYPQSSISWDRLSREISESIKSKDWCDGPLDGEKIEKKDSDCGAAEDEIVGEEKIDIKFEEEK